MIVNDFLFFFFLTDGRPKLEVLLFSGFCGHDFKIPCCDLKILGHDRANFVVT